MKKRSLRFRMMAKALMIVLLIGVAGKLYAYDFSAVCETGQTLYYNIIDATNHCVELTYPGLDQFHPWEGFNKPEGVIVLPSFVVNNEITYSLTSIKTSAFRDCNGLIGDLCIPNSVNEIEARAFEGCSGFDGQLVISNNATSIGSTAFYGCNGFVGSVDIPNSVETIGQYAFYNCSSITELTIGEGVSSIGQYAFWNCSDLTIVHFNALNCNTMYTKYNSMYMSVFGLTPSIIELTIGSNVQSIPDYAFKRCLNITSQLVIPNSVVTIGESAFSVCSGLSGNLVIPNSVISIGYSAFSYCSGFSGDLIIPNSVISIGNSAFLHCSGFTGLLSIGNSITSIGSETFSYCSGFTSLNLSNSMNEIGDFAFYNCLGINEISIPNSVNSIGIESFVQTGWYNNHINGVLYLDDWCLGYKGEGINSIQIRDGIKHIANGAFMMDNDLISISIPNSVTTIGNNTFANCENLSSVDLSNSLTAIEDNTFSLCSSLHSITLPKSLISIGDFAFWQSGLQSIVIPNSVSLIGVDAFELCELLRFVILGSAVIEIGEYAFGSCWALNSVTSLSQYPPINGDEVFLNISQSIQVYVPYGSIDTYLAAFGWSSFTNYQEIAYRTISGYVESDGLWQLIASPLVDNVSPETVDNLMLATDYDLYQFNPLETEGQWQNHKADNFDLVNGQGYLYASEEEVNIVFKGEFNENETKVVELVYDEVQPNVGWNLVGNPFPVSTYIDRDYYVMNEDGTSINPVAVPASTPIPPCTGVMVKVNGPNETVVFTRVVP